ncbi:MAG TPA: hypothetical protein VF221_01800 [Chloroflexota bacterium]
MIAIAIQQIESVIMRLTKDASFRIKYCQDPDKALESYLSPEEIRAIKTGDGYALGSAADGARWQELTAALCGSDPGS